MASIPVDFIAGKIASLLEHELSLLSAVRVELEQIRDELLSMRAFLHDADRRKGLTQADNVWVSSVRDKVYDVEDVIDEFMYYMNKLRRRESLFARVLNRTIRFPNTLLVRHKIAVKLREIKNGLKAVKERHGRYGGETLEGVLGSSYDYKRMRNLAESSLFFGNDDLVGIENARELLLKWLMEAQPKRTVIAVFGMGGSGKTTLVANTYNSIQKRGHNFDSFAWVTVSQTFVVEDLLRTMVIEFFKATKENSPSDLNNMSYRGLVETLVNYLNPKRYLLVLDDVWDINLWPQIKVALPEGIKGSRILLTTRNEDIATLPFGIGSHFHHIRLLPNNEAWTLFCMKAFATNHERLCPPELEKIARELIEKCDGLPLAIVTLGGVMSTKQLELEWRQIYNSLNYELNNNPKLEVLKSILWLSFIDLPFQLKPCFLYCCAFPEDYPIEKVRLTRLWMAEGFVEGVRDVSAELVSNNYLNDLIRRSMLQVEEWDINRKPKVCKMHDLMRELALLTSEKDFFVFLIMVKRPKLTQEHADYQFKLASSNILPSGFKFLRVLDLEESLITKLPEEIKSLFNLRYLSLKSSKIKELPKSIGRLLNLQTLDISQTQIQVLPNEILRLQNMRHLIMYHYNNPGFNFEFNIASGTRMPTNISKLKNLQFLVGVESKVDLLSHVKNLTQLECLGISKLRASDETILCNSIQELNFLEDLFLMASNEDEYLRIDAMSSPPPNILVLSLIGKLEKVPKWFHSLQRLTYLNLRWSRLTEDFIPHIHALPNLVTLLLVNTYTGTQLCFPTGFRKIVSLEISNFGELNEIVFGSGVMPCLEKLVLCCCPELKTPPLGIEHFPGLLELNMVSASAELVDGIREAQKTWKIAKITNNFHTQSGYFFETIS